MHRQKQGSGIMRQKFVFVKEKFNYYCQVLAEINMKAIEPKK